MKPAIQVDFGAPASQDGVILSDSDFVRDARGHDVKLSEGLDVVAYDFDMGERGEMGVLMCDGRVERSGERGLRIKWRKWRVKLETSTFRFLELSEFKKECGLDP